MIVGTLKGCETSSIPFGQELAPLQGANHSCRLTGGLRFAPILRLLSNFGVANT